MYMLQDTLYIHVPNMNISKNTYLTFQMSTCHKGVLHFYVGITRDVHCNMHDSLLAAPPAAIQFHVLLS